MDYTGLWNACPVVFTVVDNENPVVLEDCSTTLAMRVPADLNNATYSNGWRRPLYSDNVGAGFSLSIVNPLYNVTGVGAEDDLLWYGLNTITYYFEDAAMNNATCSFVIDVYDTTPPAPEGGKCPTKSMLATEYNVALQVYEGPWTPHGEPNFTDNVGVEIVRTTHVFTPLDGEGELMQPLPVATIVYGSPLAVGDHDIFVTAIDAAGLEFSCRMTIRVGEYRGPVLDCPDDRLVATKASSDVGVISGLEYYDGGWPAATALGAIADKVYDVLNTTPSIPVSSQLGVGEHLIVYTATDFNGTASTCSFMYTVRESQRSSRPSVRYVFEAHAHLARAHLALFSFVFFDLENALTTTYRQFQLTPARVQ
jgi:hypothetical protein